MLVDRCTGEQNSRGGGALWGKEGICSFVKKTKTEQGKKGGVLSLRFPAVEMYCSLQQPRRFYANGKGLDLGLEKAKKGGKPVKKTFCARSSTMPWLESKRCKGGQI